MMRFIAFILATGFLMSCAARPQRTKQAASPPQRPEQAATTTERSERALHSYSVGVSRKEVRADLADSWLLASAMRPVNGWSREVSPPSGGHAARFESSIPALSSRRAKFIWSAILMPQRGAITGSG